MSTDKASLSIRTVVFDIDDTLVPWDTVAHWQWAWHPNGPVLPERRVLPILRRALHRWDRQRWQALVGSAPVADEAAYRRHLDETLTQIAGHPLPPIEHEAVINRFVRPAGGVEPYPEAARALDQLRSMGVHVAAATGHPRSIAESMLRRAGLGPGLKVLAREDTGADALPHRKAFRSVCEQLESEPQATLFVGDLFWSDYRAAGRAGLNALLMERATGPERTEAARIHSLTEVAAHLTGPPPSMTPDTPPDRELPGPSTEVEPQ
ncbi:MAG: HAD family hydrolase [Thermoplasmata archaeon]